MKGSYGASKTSAMSRSISQKQVTNHASFKEEPGRSGGMPVLIRGIVTDVFRDKLQRGRRKAAPSTVTD